MQSGSPLFYTRSNKAREAAFKVGHILNSNFSSRDSKDLLKVLQQAPAADILAVSNNDLIIGRTIVIKSSSPVFQRSIQIYFK